MFYYVAKGNDTDELAEWLNYLQTYTKTISLCVSVFTRLKNMDHYAVLTWRTEMVPAEALWPSGYQS